MTIAHNVSFGGVFNTASATSLATGSATPTAGDTVVGAVVLKSTTTLTSIVDSQGATVNILPAFGPSLGTKGELLYVFYVLNVTAVARTFTANYTPTAACSIIADSFTGLATGTPFDQSVSATGTGTALNSGLTSTTTFPNELVVGYALTDDSTNSITWTGDAGDGFAGLGNAGANSGGFLSLIGSYKVVVATGTYGYKPSSSVSLPWLALTVTFADTNVPSNFSLNVASGGFSLLGENATLSTTGISTATGSGIDHFTPRLLRRRPYVTRQQKQDRKKALDEWASENSKTIDSQES